MRGNAHVRFGKRDVGDGPEAPTREEFAIHLYGVDAPDSANSRFGKDIRMLIVS